METVKNAKFDELMKEIEATDNLFLKALSSVKDDLTTTQ